MRVRTWLLPLSATVLVALGVGCRRTGTPPGTDRASGSRDGQTQAKPVSGGGGGTEPLESAVFTMDERTWRPHETLVLRLDYFPDPRPGSTNLPACVAPLAADTAVGEAVCEGDGGARAPVRAANIDQDCYTDSRQPRVPAREPLVLKGCGRARIAMSRFDPPLRIDLESR